MSGKRSNRKQNQNPILSSRNLSESGKSSDDLSVHVNLIPGWILEPDESEDVSGAGFQKDPTIVNSWHK